MPWFLIPALLLISLGAFALIAASLLDSWRLTSPAGYVHPRPASFRYERTPMIEHRLPYQDIEVSAQAGVIRGWLVPAAADKFELAIVALHGRGGDRTDFMRHLPMFHEANATVALIDMRENGLSDGRGRGTGLAMREADDAILTAAALRQRGYRRIVVYGCSLGASAAIIAGGRDPEIAGVIAESPIADFGSYVGGETEARLTHRLGFGFRPLAEVWGRLVVWLTRIRLGYPALVDPSAAIAGAAPRPVLLIHGLRDTGVPPVHTRVLAQRGGAFVQTWLIEEGGHCNGIVVSPQEYRAQIARFLRLVVNSRPPGAS
jgi:pimeloyl-ACP methyl ester carboxylesterase